MVHALQQTHKILQPDGILISVHNISAPHVVEVHSPGDVHMAGWLTDIDGFENERSAFNALAKVVEQRIFNIKDERDFAYDIHVDSLIELQEWLAEWWTTARLPDQSLQQLDEQIRDAGEQPTYVLALKARMTKLQVVELE